MRLDTILKLFLLFILLFTNQASAEDVKKAEDSSDAIDIKNGAELYKKCALCHGQFAQGIIGGLYPRLAGMPEYYVLEQIKKYKEGNRSDDFSLSMLEIGGMRDLDEKKSKDLAAFLAAIDLDKHYPLTIPKPMQGDPVKGKELFMDDCKTCHGKKANGKAKKDSPPLAGQYTEYLIRETDFFKAKHRYHDNDPEDETFDEYSKQELNDIFAYIATIPFAPEKGYPDVPDMPLIAMVKPPVPEKPAQPDAPKVPERVESSGNTQSVKIESITQTVLKMAIKDDIKPDDAIEAMKSKALELNMKAVAHQPVSKELEARGIDSPRLEIFQYCNPEDAMKLVKFNTIFAAYMPCRIALVEDNKGKFWLEMLNLDMVINSVALPPGLNKIAIETNGKMLDILTAGATGEF